MTRGAGHEFTIDLTGTDTITRVTRRFLAERLIFEEFRQVIGRFVATEHLVELRTETHHRKPAQRQYEDEGHNIQNERHLPSLRDHASQAPR